MIPTDLGIEDLVVGQSANFQRSFTAEDVENFAELSGDYNPLHLDESYAQTTPFKQRLVHGMLVASLCSQLVGMHLPGKRCLYLSQTLAFKKPVLIGDALTVHGTIESISLSTKVVQIAISIQNTEEEVMNGTAMIQVL